MPASTLLTAAGYITLKTAAGALTSLSFTQKEPLLAPSADDPLIQTIKKEIMHWFQHRDHIFTFPVILCGTSFQQRVWTALQQIPVGETRTYGELATHLKTSARAIGNACRSNPIPLIIPCHRVVAKTGPGGYAGTTTGQNMIIKSTLLALEKTL